MHDNQIAVLNFTLCGAPSIPLLSQPRNTFSYRFCCRVSVTLNPSCELMQPFLREIGQLGSSYMIPNVKWHTDRSRSVWLC
jgi:hypothetical protein